jgi:hypothetical protein
VLLAPAKRATLHSRPTHAAGIRNTIEGKTREEDRAVAVAECFERRKQRLDLDPRAEGGHSHHSVLDYQVEAVSVNRSGAVSNRFLCAAMQK